MNKTRPQVITIQAAGRTFSRKNQEKITTLWRQLGDLLIGSGLVGADDLSALLKEAQAKPEAESEGQEDEVPGAEIAAGSFTEDVRSATWFDSFNRALDLFRSRFLELHRLNESGIERKYGVQTSRYTEAVRMVDEMAGILKEQCERFPGFSLDTSMGSMPGYYNEMMPPIYASAVEPSPGEETPVVSEGEASEEESPDETLTTEISASQDIDLSIVCATEIAAAQRKGNRLPIKGVLFRVDEPSESPPSKGSNLPLYVPRHVAELAAAAVNESQGLPLDVDDSLSQHANNHIAGVFFEASVNSNDFIVQGHLFPWSQPEKVELVSANKKRLGMSMNAHATGHVATVEGCEVFYIDSLELLGANILYSNRATYQQTKLLAASAAETKSGIDMDLEEQLKKFGDTLTDISAATRRDSETLTQLQSGYAELRQLVSEIQTERQQIQASAQAQATEQQKQKEVQTLIAAISQSIDERLAKQKEELLDIVNPSRQPTRPTRSSLVSLVASNQGTTENAVSGQHVQLIQAEAALQELRRSGGDEGRRGELIEEIRELKYALGVA